MVVTAKQNPWAPPCVVGLSLTQGPSRFSEERGLLYKKGHLLEKLRPLAFSKGGGQNRTPPLERYALGVSKG
jgi:hypothetical protein